MLAQSLTQSNSVRAARLLFFLLSLILAVFAVLTVRHGTPMWTVWLMALDAVLLNLAGWLLSRRSTLFFFAAVLLAAGNAIAILFDEMGPVDFALLAAFLVLLLLLALRHDQFLPQKTE
jgi:hypothetical protein